MKSYGMDLGEGASIKNLTAPQGDSFPDNANAAELFYLTQGDVGLYLFTDQWLRIATESEVVNRHVCVLLDGSSSSVSHTIPEASTLDGFRYTMKRIDDSPFSVVASFDSSSTVEGDDEIDIYGNEAITLISKNGSWYYI